MGETREYLIERYQKAFFNNKVDYCIGTGRMGLALQKEYMDQLALVQKEIGFSHIRGHGLFSDDMAICQEYKNEKGETCVEYNFTYLDLVMDSYKSVSLKPFLELGFMPEKMASGTQTVFYWKGNVTPPKSYDLWCDMVQATLKHLMERYGKDEVVTWPIEVWNEPNLPGFWKDADMQEYFKLFKRTFNAIKEVDTRFRVGGPAICGVDDVNWMKSFLEFCHKERIPVDFITRHHYTIELPDRDGHYDYTKLTDSEETLATLQVTRDIVDSFEEYKKLEIHITEFNTSYTPKSPIHDTNLNAAYIAHQLSRLGDVNESYSYWTFGDIFEEEGVPFTPFHGGFGLVANGCIPKPTFWAFKFFKDLQVRGECALRTDECVVIRREDGSYCGTAWNKSDESLDIKVQIALETDAGEYCLLTKTVDEDTCNPLKLWHMMGEPASLSENQKRILIDGAKPQINAERASITDGNANINLSIKKNGVVYFEVFPVADKSDRGYSYAKVMKSR